VKIIFEDIDSSNTRGENSLAALFDRPDKCVHIRVGEGVAFWAKVTRIQTYFDNDRRWCGRVELEKINAES
jgi:hypothetical protein